MLYIVMKNSELLLPVGNMKMCEAAIHNGAGAVYMGMPYFNARGRSTDFEFQELKQMIDLCHLYGVKVHLAFNILIFENELTRATEVLDEVMKLGPDAFIVQDLGLVRLIRSRYPKMEIHASTQMTVTNHEAIELLDDLEIKRFVLGRENSLTEIRKIRENTTKELEVFVHGALCVAYSGQCFTSEALGGRSANRGQCAQSCRFDYELIVDGKKKDLIEKRYLVSPKDLCGIDEIPELQEIGVESFKVEGRLKSPEFVASVGSEYTKAIYKQNGFDSSLARKKMGVNFSRGFYSGWLHGVAHQELVEGSFSSHRGVFIGELKGIKEKTLLIETNEDLRRGQGILIAFEDHGKKELGGKIYDVRAKGKYLEVSLGHEFSYSKVKANAKVYLNSDDNLSKELIKTFEDRNLKKHIPISLKVFGFEGSPLKIVAECEDHKIEIQGSEKLQLASKAPIDEALLMKAFGGLSQTAYVLSDLENKLEGKLFISNGELKSLKKELVESLNLRRMSFDYEAPVEVDFKNLKNSYEESSPSLSILFRKKDQLDTFLNSPLKDKYKDYLSDLILDYEFGKDFVPSVKDIKASGLSSSIATTRILKPSEYHNFTLIERANPDSLLIRNLGALKYFKDSHFSLHGDFSLNVTNHLSADYLISKGLKTVTASYDLNSDQLGDLISSGVGPKLSITAHQYMPEFHMEHCVFAAFLSKGNSFRDCGKPCEKHEVKLKDMYGNYHEIKADQECRNTFFRAEAQSAATLIPSWMDKGVSNFRIELLYEKDEELLSKIETYLKLIAKEMSSKEVLEKMKSVESYGVSAGLLLDKDNYKDRKKVNIHD